MTVTLKPTSRKRTARKIRTLRHGEATPPGEPGRYLSAQGYVRLRWSTPDGLVEIYEHRHVMGNPPSEMHVHHKNGIKHDNRPENLELLTPAAHGSEHAQIDIEEAARLYREGLSTPEIGRRLGFANPTVYRALVRHGVPIRSSGEANRLDLPEDEIRQLHQAGVRCYRIAGIYGVSPAVIQTRVHILGLTPHREGRPTNAEIASAKEAIRRLVA